MAALIASPNKNTSHRMSCILMEKLKKHLKGFFVLCLVSVCFIRCISKIPKRKKKLLFSPPKKGKPKEKKKRNRRTGVCSLCGRDPGLLIHNSQFKTVQIDTDYRHMICLGFAPVNIEIFFFSFLFSPAHPPPMAYMTRWW